MTLNNKINVTLICNSVAIILLAITSFLHSYRFHSDKDIVQNSNYVQDLYIQKMTLSYYSCKERLVESLDAYIEEIAPHSAMNSLTFVNYCEEYDIDVFFVLSQCQIESKFATVGLGSKTYSAFNIKAYDGKGDKYMDKYKHPDLSIEPYIKVLKDTYLVDGVTEFNLMDNYVNINGQRYASDEQYETKLRSVYEKLLTKYEPIYNEYKKYKLLSGK